MARNYFGGVAPAAPKRGLIASPLQFGRTAQPAGGIAGFRPTGLGGLQPATTPRPTTDLGYTNDPRYGRGFGYSVYDPFNPGGQIDRAFGGNARSFFESGGIDPGLFDSIRQRSQADSGARRRAALLGLQARGGDIPGAYGTVAALSDLGAASDLSRGLNEADIQQRGQAQKFKQEQLDAFLQYIRQLEAQGRGAQQQQDLQKSGAAQARKGQKKGLGISLGFGPVSVGLAEGGIVNRPTRALIGEAGREAVIPEKRLPSGMTLEDLLAIIGEAPERPTPLAEPEPYKPQGFWERLGGVARNVRVGVSPEASGAVKALGLGLGAAGAYGEGRLAESEGIRDRAAKRVTELNQNDQGVYEAALKRHEKLRDLMVEKMIDRLLNPPKEPKSLAQIEDEAAAAARGAARVTTPGGKPPSGGRVVRDPATGKLVRVKS